MREHLLDQRRAERRVPEQAPRQGHAERKLEQHVRAKLHRRRARLGVERHRAVHDGGHLVAEELARMRDRALHARSPL
jgi:hypothetical protein